MDIPKSYIIEFPGRVEFPEAALDQLQIGDSVSINWNPGNPVSHSLRSEKSDFTGFILKVKEGDAEVQSVVTQIYKFNELCDFAYTPSNLPSNEFLTLSGFVNAQGRQFEKLVTEEPVFTSEPFLPVAPRISEIAIPVDSIVGSKNIAGSSRSSDPWKQFVYYSTSQVPPPLALKIAGDKGHDKDELWNSISDLFNKRPVWSKMMLGLHVPTGVSKKQLLKVLTKQAYRFADGPWCKLWIKRSYDPRKEPEAKQYQSVIYTLPPYYEVYVEGSYFKAARSGKLAFFKARAKHDNAAIDLNKLDAWPVEKTTIFQVCDLEDDEIRSILGGPSQGRSSYGFGWFSADEWGRVQDIVETRLRTKIEFELAKPETDSESGGLCASFLGEVPDVCSDSSPSSDLSYE